MIIPCPHAVLWLFRFLLLIVLIGAARGQTTNLFNVVQNGKDFDVTMQLPAFPSTSKLQAKVRVIANGDGWDRSGRIWLETASGQVDLVRFVTGFGGTYWNDPVDVTALRQLLQGQVRFRGNIDDVWMGAQAYTMDLQIEEVPGGYSGPQVIWTERVIDAGANWGSTAFNNGPLTFNVSTPPGATRVFLTYYTHGHGGSDGTGCCEFNSRPHRVTVDGTEVLRVTPWRDYSTSLRDRNPNAGAVGGSLSSDLARSNWKPGDVVHGFVVDVTAALTGGTGGTHAVTVNVEGGELGGDGYWLSGAFLSGTVHAAHQILMLPVAAGADDAEEASTGTVSLTSSDLELTDDPGSNSRNQTIGLRFASLPLPRGTTLLSAALQFTADETQSEVTSLTIHAQAADSAPLFTTAARDLSMRARSSAAVTWSPPAWTTAGERGAAQRSPDMTALVNEVLNRPGWSPGNAMAFLISGTGHRTARAAEERGGPVLVLTYEPPQSLTVSPAASADDAEQAANGTVSITSTDLELVNDGTLGDQRVGIRFPNVSVPPGSTIVDAAIQFTANEDSPGASSLTIRAQASDNAPAFQAVANNISARPLTNAGVPWSPPVWSVVDESAAAQRTPDVGALLREVIARPGWAAGNAMVFVISGTGRRTADAFDNTTAVPAKLVVNYISPFLTTASQPDASADDAEESAAGAMSLTSTDLELVNDGGQGNQKVGVRFPFLFVPHGHRIRSAHIQFTAKETQIEATSLTIRGQFAGDAATFATTAGNIASRPLTAASVPWSPPAWDSAGEAAAAQLTPDLSAVLQEIVNRPDWVEGHAAAFIITGSGHRTADSIDKTGGIPARLTVTYDREPAVLPPDPNFRITSFVPDFTADPPSLTLTWNSQAGATYVLESSANLTDWVPAAGFLTSDGPTTTRSLTLPGGQAKLYIRLKVRS